MFRLLVCGDRNYTDYQMINKVLADFHTTGTINDVSYCEPFSKLLIIHGDCKGADSLAKNFAKLNNHEILTFPANWNKYGLNAGPIRNQQMLDVGKPQLVIAFHTNIDSSKGTKHMMNIARNMNIPTILIS